MPSLGGATEWLNSEPLDPAALRGRVILVDFWTLTCINWLRTDPYIRAWSRAYRDDGLVVIGVHTPEFSFEHELDLVWQATKEREIEYPVAVDSDYEIWNAFANHYWPALYFVDTEGIIRDHHFGEGRYEQSERRLQRLLGVDRETVAGRGVRRGGGGRLGPPAHAGDLPRRPRGEVGRPATRPAPREWTLAGAWTPGPRTSCSPSPAGASPSASTRGTRTWCCLAGARAPIPFRVLLDGEPPGAVARRGRGRAMGTACSGTAASTTSVREAGTVRERTLESRSRGRGRRVRFTFG